MHMFVNTKEFQKNTKENMPLMTFCSNFLQKCPINSIQFLQEIATYVLHATASTATVS